VRRRICAQPLEPTQSSTPRRRPLSSRFHDQKERAGPPEDDTHDKASSLFHPSSGFLGVLVACSASFVGRHSRASSKNSLRHCFTTAPGDCRCGIEPAELNGTGWRRAHFRSRRANSSPARRKRAIRLLLLVLGRASSHNRRAPPQKNRLRNDKSPARNSVKKSQQGTLRGTLQGYGGIYYSASAQRGKDSTRKCPARIGPVAARHHTRTPSRNVTQKS
jgi:hypothetical protein